MWEGTTLFEAPVDAGGFTTFADPTAGYTVDPNTGDVVGGSGTVGVAAGAPTSSAVNSWLTSLKGYAGTALDAYKSYTGLQNTRAQIDAAQAAQAAADDRARQAYKLQSDLLGFSGNAERARAAASAARAQQGYAATVAGGASGASLPIGLVLLVAGGWLLLRHA